MCSQARWKGVFVPNDGLSCSIQSVGDVLSVRNFFLHIFNNIIRAGVVVGGDCLDRGLWLWLLIQAVISSSTCSL